MKLVRTIVRDSRNTKRQLIFTSEIILCIFFKHDSVGIAPGFFTEFRKTLGPIEPPIRWVPWSIYQRVRKPVRETDHSPPSLAEVKNGGAIPPFSYLRGMALN
jgi:hypothetical protein